jgi:hypothetical protein
MGESSVKVGNLSLSIRRKNNFLIDFAGLRREAWQNRMLSVFVQPRSSSNPGEIGKLFPTGTKSFIVGQAAFARFAKAMSTTGAAVIVPQRYHWTITDRTDGRRFWLIVIVKKQVDHLHEKSLIGRLGDDGLYACTL